MATFTVTTAADTVDAGDGALSLREAIQRANATDAADTIVFADALEGRTLTLTQGQLTLTGGPADLGRGTELAIDGDADRDGAKVTLSGGGAGRVLEVQDGAEVALAGLGVTGGFVEWRGEGVSQASGAGILVGAHCRVTIDGCRVHHNTADYYDPFHYGIGSGGGIASGTGSYLTIRRSEIDCNSAAGSGGGIAVLAGATRYASLTLTESYVHHNTADAYLKVRGGGVAVHGSATIEATTIAHNTAHHGGGLAGGTVRLEDSTVAGNLARGARYGYTTGSGGGILGGDVTLQGSTVTGNRTWAPDERSYAAAGIAGPTVRVSDSIVAGNYARGHAADIGEAYSYVGSSGRSALAYSNGRNVFGSIVEGSVPGDLQGVAAGQVFAALDPETGGGLLAPNGGPMPTVALRDALGNPALGGAAPPAEAAADQRGVPRSQPAGTNPDLGAFELAQAAVSTRPTVGNDVLTGTAAADAVAGLAGADLVRGLGGSDDLRGGDGSDTLRGGAGDDGLAGGTGNDVLDGEAGRDLLEGGTGSNLLDGGAGTDRVSYTGDALPLGLRIDLAGDPLDGLDLGIAVRGSERDLLVGIEDAEGSRVNDSIFGTELANRLSGVGGDDLIRGLAGDDVLAGGLGNDRLHGGADFDLVDYTFGRAVVVDLGLADGTATRGTEADTLQGIEGAIGSGGADTLRGDAPANLFRGQGGKDTLTGGAGADDFDLDVLAHSAVGANRDVITDFAPGSDDLDLATIDARSATPAINDAFAFLPSRGAAFTGAGQVRWYQSAGNTLVEANVDANLAPDLQVQLTGLKALTAGDFVL
jgi:CSLREA domain-containing protein